MNELALVDNARHHPKLELPNQLDPYIILLEDPTGLPVCKKCEAAILPKSLLDHLRKRHELPTGLRGLVRAFVETLPPLDFENVPPKPDGSPFVDPLRVVDAYQCKRCHFIRRDLTDVRKHINREHNVSASGSYTQIEAQSWFGGRRAVYWRAVPKIRTLSEVPPCVWAFFGQGFGHRRPTAWTKEEVAKSLVDT